MVAHGFYHNTGSNPVLSPFYFRNKLPCKFFLFINQLDFFSKNKNFDNFNLNFAGLEIFVMTYKNVIFRILITRKVVYYRKKKSQLRRLGAAKLDMWNPNWKSFRSLFRTEEAFQSNARFSAWVENFWQRPFPLSKRNPKQRPGVLWNYTRI